MKNFMKAWRNLQREVHATATKSGFHDQKDNMGEQIALMHSELSEALEAIRRPVLRNSTKIPDYLEISEELADVVIRIMDFCEENHLAVGEAIIAKAEYNKSRPHKHGGKKF